MLLFLKLHLVHMAHDNNIVGVKSTGLIKVSAMFSCNFLYLSNMVSDTGRVTQVIVFPLLSAVSVYCCDAMYSVVLLLVAELINSSYLIIPVFGWHCLKVLFYFLILILERYIGFQANNATITGQCDNTSWSVTPEVTFYCSGKKWLRQLH